MAHEFLAGALFRHTPIDNRLSLSPPHKGGFSFARVIQIRVKSFIDNRSFCVDSLLKKCLVTASKINEKLAVRSYYRD